jgi:uncharacterized protein
MPSSPLLVAKNDKLELALLPALANRHGLVTGATGTGSELGRQVLRGVLGSILGGKRR